MTAVAHFTRPRYHPGSTRREIEDEPDWRTAGLHRIGLRNRQNHFPGLTNRGDEWLKEELEYEAHAIETEEELKKKIEHGELLTVRDVMAKQEDFHLRRPEVYSRGWRYVLHTTEDFIKNQQDWPVNVEKRKREEEDRRRREEEEKDLKKEHEWRRDRGENATHQNAYAPKGPEDKQQEQKEADSQAKEQEEKKKEDMKTKYSAQEMALLRALQHEKEYIQSLKQNDGKGKSPLSDYDDGKPLCIDEADQFTPDNWVPRNDELIRITGKHPLNCETPLSMLYDAGLTTPNKIHFVRSHGAVPHLRWHTHRLDVENGKLILSMEELKDNFDSINIPVFIACDGNRRKEVNMVKRSKGSNWGPGACGCAYWKGPLLRDVLLAAGVPSEPELRTRSWVNFEGADHPNDGKYATCIPLEYAMDASNDVILAYEMNDKALPPDHGYPVRVVIPGYVGGRCVKWLSRIWTSEKENDSYYHIYDNRVLPNFIIEMDSEFAKTMFAHPSTACTEQNLNSIIVKPAHGETLDLVAADKKRSDYRVEGIAYCGGGHEVQRVEISLDGGENWLYCIRRFPEAPIRHGKKFWTWVHWHVDVDIAHLARASEIAVRCFGPLKNTQPRRLNWNITGMMNNCWYVVRTDITQDPKSGDLSITFQHPTVPGSGTGGWMRPSTEDQIEQIRHEVAAPQKQFTRQEIEKHDSESDCWIVVNNKVYDATSVLSWHPGGAAAILAHAGRVHTETTEEFDSIHDDYAQQKLSECVLGVVTDKAKEYIKKQAEETAKARAKAATDKPEAGIQRHKWTQVRFKQKKQLSEDTRVYTFSLPPGTKSLGLGTCEHVQLGFHFSDKLVIRPYTPVRPIFENEEDGTFNLVVKTYFPTTRQPGGTISNVLDCLRPNEEVEVKGPAGVIRYEGHGQFIIDGKKHRFSNVTLILGGSGITPGYQLIARILRSDAVPGGDKDTTGIKVIDANKTEDDILLVDELNEFAKQHPQQFQIVHVLAEPKELTEGRVKGLVNKGIIRKYGFEPKEKNVALLCGPPGLIKFAAVPNLKDWGYQEDVNLFGF